MTDTIEIPHSLARLLMAEDSDFKDPAMAGDARELARASLRLLVATADVHDNGHRDPAPHDPPAAAPKRFMSAKAKKAISVRMKRYWREKRAERKGRA